MTCLGCVAALAGFGQDEAEPVQPNEVSKEAVEGMKNSLAMLLGVPAAGSVLGAVVGAVAWRNHRVIGGLIGWFVGGMLGGGAGAMLASRELNKSVIPEAKSFIGALPTGRPPQMLDWDSLSPEERLQIISTKVQDPPSPGQTAMIM